MPERRTLLLLVRSFVRSFERARERERGRKDPGKTMAAKSRGQCESYCLLASSAPSTGQTLAAKTWNISGFQLDRF